MPRRIGVSATPLMPDMSYEWCGDYIEHKESTLVAGKANANPAFFL